MGRSRRRGLAKGIAGASLSMNMPCFVHPGGAVARGPWALARPGRPGEGPSAPLWPSGPARPPLPHASRSRREEAGSRRMLSPMTGEATCLSVFVPSRGLI